MIITKKITEQLNLKSIPKSNVLYGNKNGFDVFVIFENYGTLIKTSVHRNGNSPLVNDFMKLKESVENIKDFNIQGNQIEFKLKVFNSIKRIINETDNVLNEIVQFLIDNGYKNCCQACDNYDASPNQSIIKGSYYILCNSCSDEINKNINSIKENPLLGLIGALFGGGIGILSVIIFQDLGFVSTLSGFLISYLSIYGYQKLGKKMSVLGYVISFIVIFLSVEASQALTGLGDEYIYPYVLVGAVFAIGFSLFSYKKNSVTKQLT